MKLMQTFSLLLMMVTGFSQAHLYHAIRTEIQLNQTTGKVELIHRAFVADLSTLLSEETKQKKELSQADESWLKGYWQRYFALLSPEGKLLPLEWVGFEAGDHDVWIYQEYSGSIAELLKAQLHNGLLFGHFEHQTNTVDVDLGEHKSALVFTDHKTRQKLLK